MSAVSVVSFWRELDFAARVADVENAADSICALKEQSVAQRSEMMECMKKFKATHSSASEVPLADVNHVLGVLQSGLSTLSKRSKNAEDAMLAVFTWMTKAPSPLPVMEDAAANASALEKAKAELAVLKEQLAAATEEIAAAADSGSGTAAQPSSEASEKQAFAAEAKVLRERIADLEAAAAAAEAARRGQADAAAAARRELENELLAVQEALAATSTDDSVELANAESRASVLTDELQEQRNVAAEARLAARTAMDRAQAAELALEDARTAMRSITGVVEAAVAVAKTAQRICGEGDGLDATLLGDIAQADPLDLPGHAARIAASLERSAAIFDSLRAVVGMFESLGRTAVAAAVLETLQSEVSAAGESDDKLIDALINRLKDRLEPNHSSAERLPLCSDAGTAAILLKALTATLSSAVARNQSLCKQTESAESRLADMEVAVAAMVGNRNAVGGTAAGPSDVVPSPLVALDTFTPTFVSDVPPLALSLAGDGAPFQLASLMSGADIDDTSGADNAEKGSVSNFLAAIVHQRDSLKKQVVELSQQLSAAQGRVNAVSARERALRADVVIPPLQGPLPVQSTSSVASRRRDTVLRFIFGNRYAQYGILIYIGVLNLYVLFMMYSKAFHKVHSGGAR